MFTMMPAAVQQAGGVVLWTPASLPSLYAWYKADSPLNTLTGSNFNTLKDLSGNGRDASVSGVPLTKVAGIIGGRDILRSTTGGNGIAEIASSVGFLNGKSGASVGMMTLPTYTGSSNLGHLFATETPSSTFARFYLRYPGPTALRPSILGRRLDADSLQTVTATSNVTGATALIANVNYASASAEIRANGTSVASSAFQTAGTVSATNANTNASMFAISSGGGYGGDTGEVVVSNAALSASDAQKLEGYLAWQWGQQGSLPAGHPYKSAPPTV